MPGALWKPLPNPSETRMSRYDLVVIHTMVGSLAGTDGYFRRLTNGVNSHFGTGGYGENWQWVDTSVRSGANGAGNHRAITIENADMGPGFKAWNTKNPADVPAFTPQQIETNAQICAWAHREHGVPLVAADTSLPGERGIGYHRLGCDPYRVPGGEKWSSSYGKVCPAPRRIAQIPLIIARAQQIVNGEDDLMSALDEPIKRSNGQGNTTLRTILAHSDEHITETRRIIREEVAALVADRVWWGTHVIRGDDEQEVATIQELADSKTMLLRVEAKLDQLLTLGGPQQGLSAEQIEALVVKVLREQVVQVDVDVKQS